MMAPLVDPFSLAGKTALVTGCRRGLGHAMALGLARAGADIVGVSAQLAPEGSDIQQSVQALGRRFTGYACDLADRAALYQLIARVTQEVPVIDILVNNAGTTFRAPAADFPDEEWDRVLAVNLSAQFILAREFGKRMLARGSGKVIFIASVLSYQGGLNIPAYAASKGGLVPLVMALANEWAGRGVQVNGIAPGYIATDLNAPVRHDPQRAPTVMQRIPAGRWGAPEDLQGPVVFLASAASNYVNGEVLVVDGGWMGR